ncbi:hypothetical protein SAMN05660297_02867 [Natronincola peptidivorans]|uniref:Uncharacterized protein n=1 Tax=Natronincola peptidivorans TaxID=426128 RepID=A0A1I0FMV2_9FIRM|nr:hypothetical protein [Natronincola peptidivorans]SET59403.1 hypothetical protein SAMN05660297_02867 [Natronincola peptidivorans]
MREINWNIVMRLKLFLLMVIILLVFYVVVGGIIFDLEINWNIVIITSLIYGIFGANNYQEIKIQIPIEDKESFSVFLRNYLECTGLKIINENNDLFIVKPKFNWVDRWISSGRITLTVEENQAIVVGPSIYVEKIKILIKATF